MRIHRLFFLTACLVATILMFGTFANAGQIQGFGVQLIIADALTGIDTVYFGFSNSTTATYGIDADTVILDQYGVSVSEYELPPFPPTGIFDARFIDTRSSSGAALGQGVPVNFHKGGATASTVFADTFRVQFQPSTGGESQITLKWTLFNIGDVQPTGFIRMKYTGNDVSETVDMTSKTEEIITDDGVNKLTFYFSGTVGVKQISDIVPATFALNHAYPNPFNPTTTCRYSIKQTANTTITVFDLLGRTVATLLSGEVLPGTYDATWDGRTQDGMAAASGTYFIRMSAQYQDANGVSDQFVSVQKVMLMK